MICANTAALNTYLDRQDDLEARGAEIDRCAEEVQAAVESELLADINNARWGNTYQVPDAYNRCGWGAASRPKTTEDWVSEAFENDPKIGLALVSVVAKMASGPVGVKEHIEAKAALAALLSYVGGRVYEAVQDEAGGA